MEVPEVQMPPGSKRQKQPVAVALQYELGGQELPRVSASGRGAVAEKILELAFASGVKVRQDADLAEILAAVDLDSEIPAEALVAVAEILSYVYRANGMLPPRGAGGRGPGMAAGMAPGPDAPGGASR